MDSWEDAPEGGEEALPSRDPPLSRPPLSFAHTKSGPTAQAERLADVEKREPMLIGLSQRRTKVLMGEAMLENRAAKGCEILNFQGSYLGQFPLVSAHFWTSDHLSSSSRTVNAFSDRIDR